MTHTPLPWELEKNPAGAFIKWRGYTVAEMRPQWDANATPNPERTEANIHLLLTAVNSHASLLSALESLLGACLVEITGGGQSCEVCGRYDPFVFDHDAHDPKTACGIAAAALKLARGE